MLKLQGVAVIGSTWWYCGEGNIKHNSDQSDVTWLRFRDRRRPQRALLLLE